MKPVGFLKNGGKSWALTQSLSTGVVYTEYQGDNHAVDGKFDVIVKKVQAAKDFLAANAKPVPVKYPENIISYHDKSASQADRDAWNAYWESSREVQAYAQNVRMADLHVFEEHPIFQEDLRFVGYSKGRSSFTLDFVTKCNQSVSFASKGTSELIEAVIQQQCKNVELIGWEVSEHTGWEEVDGIRTPTYEKTPYVGRGINVRFAFFKQGANIAAKMVDE